MRAPRFAATIAALLLTAAPAWAINKCIGPGGQAVFQDAPCQGQGGEIVVKPASGYAPSPQAAAPDEQPMTEAQRIIANTAKIDRDMRKRDLEGSNGPIAKTRRAIDENTARCERDQAELRMRKDHATNNLAGATWEQSISQEMQAIAQRCDTRSHELYRQLEQYQREYDALDKS